MAPCFHTTVSSHVFLCVLVCCVVLCCVVLCCVVLCCVVLCCVVLCCVVLCCVVLCCVVLCCVVLCCVVLCCVVFAVSLHFNACDVTTQLAPDAPPPRRIQTRTTSLFTLQTLSLRTLQNQATCTHGTPSFVNSSAVFPARRNPGTQTMAARCCSSILASIAFVARTPSIRCHRCRWARTHHCRCSRPPKSSTRDCVLPFCHVLLPPLSSRTACAMQPSV